MKTNIPTENSLIEWRASKHLHHKRTRSWYVYAAIFIAGCLAYSIYTSAWSFTVVLFLVVILYGYIHEAEPPEKTIRIWERGYAIDDTFTQWPACTGYWILKGNGYFELHIEKKNGYETKIQTGTISPYDIHDILSPLLPELTSRKESTLDTIIRICKL